MTVKVPLLEETTFRRPDKLETRLEVEHREVLARLTGAYRQLNTEEAQHKPISTHAASIRHLLSLIAAKS